MQSDGVTLRCLSLRSDGVVAAAAGGGVLAATDLGRRLMPLAPEHSVEAHDDEHCAQSLV